MTRGDAHGQAALGAQGHTADGFHDEGFAHAQAVGLRGHREQKDGFKQAEMFAEADARARAKRDVGKGDDFVAVLWQEAVGFEGVGVFPEKLVPVQDPGADRDVGAGGNFLPADFVGGDGLPGENVDGRIEAQGFVDNRTGEDEGGHVSESGGASAENAVEFGMEAVFDVGVELKEVKRPAHGERGGLVAGEENGGDLVADETRVHGAAVFVAVGDEYLDEVVGDVAVGITAGGDDGVDDFVEFFNGAAASQHAGAGQPVGQAEQLSEVHAAVRGRVFLKGFAEHMNLVAQLVAEHELADYVCREDGESLGDIQLGAGFALPPFRQHGLTFPDDDVRVGLEPVGVANGRADLALALPELAFTDEKAVAEEGFKGLAADRAFGIIFAVGDHDLLHAGGGIDDVHPSSETGYGDNLADKILRCPCFEHVVAGAYKEPKISPGVFQGRQHGFENSREGSSEFAVCDFGKTTSFLLSVGAGRW